MLKKNSIVCPKNFKNKLCFLKAIFFSLVVYTCTDQVLNLILTLYHVLRQMRSHFCYNSLFSQPEIMLNQLIRFKASHMILLAFVHQSMILLNFIQKTMNCQANQSLLVNSDILAQIVLANRPISTNERQIKQIRNFSNIFLKKFYLLQEREPMIILHTLELRPQRQMVHIALQIFLWLRFLFWPKALVAWE